MAVLSRTKSACPSISTVAIALICSARCKLYQHPLPIRCQAPSVALCKHEFSTINAHGCYAEARDLGRARDPLRNHRRQPRSPLGRSASLPPPLRSESDTTTSAKSCWATKNWIVRQLAMRLSTRTDQRGAEFVRRARYAKPWRPARPHCRKIPRPCAPQPFPKASSALSAVAPRTLQLNARAFQDALLASGSAPR